ncbi:MAG: hypothetical protein LC114_05040 [Bryobacterales bacterium]|nr:hypothetical protein [Bryobacterales bacterium]
MIRSFILLLVLALVLPSIAFAATGVPMMRAVDKDEAMRGDTVIATGENLGKANVAELYLTDGKNDIKVAISEQTDTSIKFLVGKGVGFGRYSLMILTAGETPMFIEQPVKLNVVEHYTPKPPVEEPTEVPSPSATTETP